MDRALTTALKQVMGLPLNRVHRMKQIEQAQWKGLMNSPRAIAATFMDEHHEEGECGIGVGHV